jgi:hypothetical protein
MPANSKSSKNKKKNKLKNKKTTKNSFNLKQPKIAKKLSRRRKRTFRKFKGERLRKPSSWKQKNRKKDRPGRSF